MIRKIFFRGLTLVVLEWANSICSVGRAICAIIPSFEAKCSVSQTTARIHPTETLAPLRAWNKGTKARRSLSDTCPGNIRTAAASRLYGVSRHILRDIDFASTVTAPVKGEFP